MRKITYSPQTLFMILLLFSISTSIAQVGIGNTNPSSSSLLDIRDNNGDKGILVPRVDIADLTTQAPVTGDMEESLLVYNTNSTTESGFYYWSATDTEWKKLATGTNAENIYTTDGTLAENRVITQNGNPLELTGDVGENALTLRRSDNANPLGLAFRNNDGFYDASIFLDSEVTGSLVFSTIDNLEDIGAIGQTMALDDTGNVGIGTATPTTKLHIEDVTVTPDLLNDGFEDNSLAPFTSSDWFVSATPAEVNTGTYAASSGPIADSQTSFMEYTVIVPAQGASISFAYSVSSEPDFDFLRFYIDGVESLAASGNVPYTTATYNLTAGSKTLRWSYEKDINTIVGNDEAYVDDVLIAPNNPDAAVRIVDGTQGTGKVLTSDANGGASWQTPATASTAAAPSIISVKGTSNISTDSSAFSDMADMSITFTPQNSTVYVTFGASGDMALSPAPVGSFATFKLINVTAANTLEAGTTTMVTDYDNDDIDGETIMTAWNASINMFPVSVTPGASTTLKIQWQRGGVSPNVLRNSVSTQKDFSHRNLTIFD